MTPKTRIEQTAVRAQILAASLADKEPELADTVAELARWVLTTATGLRDLCAFTCQGREHRTDRHRHAPECLVYLLDSTPSDPCQPSMSQHP